MRFTDLFIRRPVLSVVVSLFIVMVGLQSARELPVRQFPRTVHAEIQVETEYYGADAELVAGFITTPLEAAVAQVNGVDYVRGTSLNGASTVEAFLRLNRDPDKALAEIQAKVSAVHDQLPPQSQTPSIRLRTEGQGNLLILAFQSDVLSLPQITDYLRRVVSPRIQAIPGVQEAEIWGGQNFALRAWLDPTALAARGLTASDVSAALAANNFTSGAGITKGQMVSVPLVLTTGLHSVEEFRRLIVREAGGATIRLGDVARVELASDDYSQSNLFNGKPAVLLDVEPAPDANVLELTKRVRLAFETVKAQLPPGMSASVAYDVTESVRSSIFEVVKTLLESLAIVAAVVLLFLRSWRAAIVPVVTIPLSLVGTFALLWAFGFSINLLTLLALVLATGLVVDDAIIVVENVTREMAEGASALDAALRSARQLASPIVAMTVVLIAVYVPIALRGGLTGALFREFALTLVGAVTVSAVIALTLSPMMCRYLLRAPAHPENHGEDALHRFYRGTLRGVLRFPAAMVAVGIVVLALSGFFYQGSQSELAPQEDVGFIQMGGSLSASATIDSVHTVEQQINAALATEPDIDRTYGFAGPGEFGGGIGLTRGEKRHRGLMPILTDLQAKLYGIAGAEVALFPPASLPGSFGSLPIEYVLKATRPYQEMNQVSEAFLQEAQKSGLFAYVTRDLKVDLPQATVVLDRDKVAALGLDMQKLGAVLNTLMSGGYVNYFDMAGRSYRVIPQVRRVDRQNPAQLLDFTIAHINGAPVPLGSVAHIETRTVPEKIVHFQQLGAATISAVPLPGVSQGDALAALDAIAARVLPPGYATDAAGQLRQFVTENSGFAGTFGVAVVVIYLSLAALFGSFRDPVIILVSVPMSLAGALVFIWLGVNGATLNIYTEVGLVTLMGLISKHGILMVEVANEQQALGMSKREAILHAALLRLRPILMTTAAMVLGVLPLVLATGTGAAARFAMGLVIASGLSIGTVFTLFVVPAFYLALARRHTADPVLEARGIALHPEGAVAD